MFLKIFAFVAAQFGCILIKKEWVATVSITTNHKTQEYTESPFSFEEQCKEHAIKAFHNRRSLVGIKIEPSTFRTTNITGSINVIDPSIKL